MDPFGPVASQCAPQGGCITCGDEAVEMQVLTVDEVRELALCSDPEGAHSTVEVALVGPVGPGDAVLVHAGTALLRLSREEAIVR